MELKIKIDEVIKRVYFDYGEYKGYFNRETIYNGNHSDCYTDNFYSFLSELFNAEFRTYRNFDGDEEVDRYTQIQLQFGQNHKVFDIENPEHLDSFTTFLYEMITSDDCGTNFQNWIAKFRKRVNDWKKNVKGKNREYIINID